MPTPMTLAMDEPAPEIVFDRDEPEPRMTIITLEEYSNMNEHITVKKATYAIGFLEGIIASSVTYIVITLIALFIGSYQ